MSRRSGHGKSQKVDLKLNLAPPASGGMSTRAAATTGSEDSLRGSSSPSSCLSSETEQEATSMVLAACPQCLMYVMLSEEDTKCPKCKRAVLFDFLRGDSVTKRTRKT